MDFDESLARLGADEASKTKHLLRNLELNLYTPANPTPLPEEYRSEPVCEYSRGYDAHVESVNIKEICLWQHQFHYLGITGVSPAQTTFPATENFDEISNIGEEESSSTKDISCPHVDDDFTRMKIIGKKLDIQSLSLPENGDEGETFASDGVLPTGDYRFVYMANGKLIEVDFRTKRTRKRQLEFVDRSSSIQIYNKDWAVITRIGYTDKNLDIAQFWHPKTDTWIRMSLGKLGKYGIRDIFLHPNGYTLINTNDDLVLKVDDLLHKLKSNDKNTFSQPTWDKKWKDESQFNFFDKIKSMVN